MNVEIGTEDPIFLFWEYLFHIFGILSLQCGHFPAGSASVEYVDPASAVGRVKIVWKNTPLTIFCAHSVLANMKTEG